MEVRRGLSAFWDDMKKKKSKNTDIYGMQAVCMTKAAALEAVARAIIDFEDTPSVTVAELSNKIVAALGFK